MFVSKLADADAEVAETQVWIDFARDCGYIEGITVTNLVRGYDEVGRMLGSMMTHPEKFKPGGSGVSK